MTPQHAVLGYRIDLVVWGMEGALAVECDGDSWHGVDRHDADAARQRDLERCGWTFEPVKEGAFKLDPDAALEDVRAALEQLGIFSGGLR
ncbi:MAG: DUF559 domain-containing protein [Actinomycetia bacterium]|nr:DUF559 domain-containing protein [Actinomycetes bacterium]